MEKQPISADAPAIWPTTHWSLVGLAVAGGDEERRRAVSSIVQLYAPALRKHLIARWQIKHDQVDDLLQEFLLSKVLVNDIFGMADQNRGKFRTFLARALDNSIRNHFRDQARIKRGGNRSEPLCDEMDLHENIGVSGDSFDYAWARQVLGQSIRQMRVQCVKTRRSDIWAVFRGRILAPALFGTEPVEYDSLVREFGFNSAKRATNVLTTGIRMFARSVQAVISRYGLDEIEVESEIRDLWRAVSGPNAMSARLSRHGE